MPADHGTKRFDPDIREWAVRVVLLEAGPYNEADIIESVARRVGCSAATLKRWLRQAQKAGGVKPGVFTNPRRRVEELEREVASLKIELARLKLEAHRDGRGPLIIGHGEWRAASDTPNPDISPSAEAA